MEVGRDRVRFLPGLLLRLVGAEADDGAYVRPISRELAVCDRLRDSAPGASFVKDGCTCLKISPPVELLL